MFIFQTEQNAQNIKKNLTSSECSGDYAFLRFELEQAAKVALTLGPFSVTFSPTMAASGCANDYFSMAPYAWQNPKAENPATAPYIHRDGERNPERLKYRQKSDFSMLSHTLQTLGAAGYFLDRTDCIERAVELIRVWFVDEQTRMNPHLEYAQAVPNVTEGRGIGIIDLMALNRVVYAAGYVNAAAGGIAGASTVMSGFDEWLGAMLEWLLNSKKGNDEANNGNNHETFFNVHTGIYALRLGRKDVLDKVCDNYRTRILPRQVESDGSMPEELKRTISFTYCAYNSEAMALLCEIGRAHGQDLWTFETDGRSLSKAIDFFLPTMINPYAKEALWKHPQIKDNSKLADRAFIQLAALRLGRKDLADLAAFLREDRRMWRQGNVAPLCLMEGYEFSTASDVFFTKENLL